MPTRHWLGETRIESCQMLHWQIPKAELINRQVDHETDYRSLCVVHKTGLNLHGSQLPVCMGQTACQYCLLVWSTFLSFCWPFWSQPNLGVAWSIAIMFDKIYNHLGPTIHEKSNIQLMCLVFLFVVGIYLFSFLTINILFLGGRWSKEHLHLQHLYE